MLRVPEPRRWLWLGAALSLFALHSEYDLPVAAWLAPIFLVRYVRLSAPRTGVVWIGIVSLLAWLLWLCSSALIVSGTAVLSFAALAGFLTVPYLLDRLLARPLAAWSGVAASLVFPLGRAACEYLFTVAVGFGNFGSLAATQHGNLPLLQIASITGSYGVSFLIAWLASTVNHAWDAGFAWPASRRVGVVYAVTLAVVMAGGAIRLGWAPADGDTVRVAGLSPSRAALHERRRTGDDAVVNDDLVARTDQEAQAGARILVWSESAARVTAATRGAMVERVAAIARRRGVYVDMALEMRGERTTNEAVLVAPDGRVAWTYQKSHPTPAEAAAGIAPGSGEVPTVDTGAARLATVICYDLDFPSLVRTADADLLLVPANDWPGIIAWHSQKAVVRAVENGVSILRQSSHGLATALDPLGRTVAHASFYDGDVHTLVAYLPVRGVTTIYRRVGDLFAWLCVAGLAALAAIARGRYAHPS